MPADEGHVLIVRFAIRIEDANLPAYLLERVGVHWRIAGGESGAVEPMLLLISQPWRRRLPAAWGAGTAGAKAERHQRDGN